MLGGLADEPLALVGKRDHTWSESVALLIGNNFDFAPFHYGHNRVGCAQVDANNFFALRHSVILFVVRP